MPSARCSRSQASLAQATQPGLQAEAARSLIGSFSIPRVHPRHSIGPAGGALRRILQRFPFEQTLLGLCSSGAVIVPLGLFEPQPDRWVTLPQTPPFCPDHLGPS